MQSARTEVSVLYDISTRQFEKRSSPGIGSVCPDVLDD